MYSFSGLVYTNDDSFKNREYTLHVFPCVYVIMEGETSEEYKFAFETIKNVIPAINIKNIITSKNENFLSGLLAIFPEVEYHVNLFNYQEDIYKLIIKNNAEHHVIQEGENDIKHFLLRLVVIPLLPSNLMLASYENLKTNASHEVLVAVEQILLNYEKIYLEDLSRGKISVYNKIKCTTKVLADYENFLNTKLETDPSSPWQFTEKLSKLHLRIVNDHSIRNHIRKKYSMHVPAVLEKEFSAQIERLWDLLDGNNHFATPMDFLSDAAYSCSQGRVEYFAVSIQYSPDVEEIPEALFVSEVLVSEGDEDLSDLSEEDPLIENGDIDEAESSVADGKKTNKRRKRDFIPRCCTWKSALPTYCLNTCGHVSLCDNCWEY
ncbi:uncharacterized protein LOC122505038 [Leptopilina heterotoma]|uniref:uncharacterized protein LOC122505038 n=1 Tax=Leptopilina heterotoma TaxID=63436 RepID=UPI001CA8FB90|nr:uncharacterized protein LOC122505038 [Leptopilina heterotoma]